MPCLTGVISEFRGLRDEGENFIEVFLEELRRVARLGDR
jgi:hypothetical protein